MFVSEFRNNTVIFPTSLRSPLTFLCCLQNSVTVTVKSASLELTA